MNRFARPVNKALPVTRIGVPGARVLAANALPVTMVDRIEQAASIVDDASELTDDSTIREQLDSVVSGLNAVAEEPDDAVKGDRLEEVEAKIVGLGDEAEDERVEAALQDARDHVDAFRRDRAQDW